MATAKKKAPAKKAAAEGAARAQDRAGFKVHRLACGLDRPAPTGLALRAHQPRHPHGVHRFEDHLAVVVANGLGEHLAAVFQLVGEQAHGPAFQPPEVDHRVGGGRDAQLHVFQPRAGDIHRLACQQAHSALVGAQHRAGGGGQRTDLVVAQAERGGRGDERGLAVADDAVDRNRRGRGLPSCGRGVIEPTSAKPKPRPSSASGTSPSLS